MRADAALWIEYDACAEWCARRGLKGGPGDPLPALVSVEVAREIELHNEEFQDRVRNTAYMLAMTALALPEE